MIEYTYDVQKLFLEMMMHDAQSFLRVQNIFNEENFDRDLRETAKFIYDHANEHKTLPDRAQTKAVTNIELLPIPDLNSGHTDWFLETFEAFTRRTELERAILKSADLLEKGEYFANLVNNNNLGTPGEVVYGQSISGVKGYYATVTIRTDDSTQVSGAGGKTRELFAVSSEYVESSY